jgi:hypothetical protein
LDAHFTEEEIHRAIFGTVVDKTTAPDDFSIKFYQYFWPLLKNDLLIFFLDFYHGNLDTSRFN